jgi:glycosyltransferase involved in cell wall biosynthesis
MDKIITVTIPCHKHGHMVKNAIMSVVEQDYPHKQIVVINDASPDNTQEVVLGLLSNTSTKGKITTGYINGIKLHLIKNEVPVKQAAGRNQGMKLCWDESTYFGFLDADDEYLPTKISKSIAKINEDPKAVGMVYSDILIKDLNDGKILHEIAEPFSKRRIEQECITKNTIILSKYCIEQCGVYEPGFAPCEDFLLSVMISRKMCIVHIPEALSVYHLTGQNCTVTMPLQQWRVYWQEVARRIQNNEGNRYFIKDVTI